MVASVHPIFPIQEFNFGKYWINLLQRNVKCKVRNYYLLFEAVLSIRITSIMFPVKRAARMLALSKSVA